MKLFLPDWDDRVDPGYDFLTDRFTLHRDPYRDDLYAHELLDERPYDGILLSRSAFNDSGPKRLLLEQLGTRRYLRLPADMELLGDCGAFSYVAEKEPKYQSKEVVEFYERFGFDYGVSVDHLIVPQFESERLFRYNLTLRNAEDFLSYFREAPRHFTPIGAVQGWDPPSYVEAAQAIVGMGYDYLAIGGLARSTTPAVKAIVSAVRLAIPKDVRVHVFGVARANLLSFFSSLDITSVDSAAPLRQAWLSARDNYYTRDRTYAAIRIPVAVEERARASQTLLARSPVVEGGLQQLVDAEKHALASVRDYDRGLTKLNPALDAVMAYDQLLGTRIYEHKAETRLGQYRDTLRDKPWKKCACKVCRDLGVEVVIFRGNNRNRRRGFHNIQVVYKRLQELRQNHNNEVLAAQLPLSGPLLADAAG